METDSQISSTSIDANSTMSEQSSVWTDGNAALRGLCFYLAASFVFLHGLVVRDWSKYDANYTREVEVNLPEHEVDMPKFGVSDLPDFPSPDEIDDLVQDIRALPQRTKLGKVSNILDDYNATLSKWKNQNVAAAPLISDGSQSIGRLKFGNLLQHASLSNLTDDDLTTLFTFSLSELQRMVGDKKQLQWQSVNDILSPETPFPKREKLTEDELHDMLCVSKVALEADDEDDEDGAIIADEDEDEDEDDEDEDVTTLLAQYAKEEDLEAYFLTAESLLDHLQSDPKKKCLEFKDVENSLARGTKELKQGFIEANSIIESAAEEENEKTDASLEEHNDNEVSCEGETHEDDIDELLDAGLGALARHRDIRAALLDVLKEVDPESAKNLILDADFDIETPGPRAKSPEEIRLRALLDSPLLRNIGTTVDRFLDVISGYYDPLDHRIDQLTERLVDTSNKETSSLGRAFVSTVWDWSGQMAIPIPPPLREYLEKSPRGRTMLAYLY